jgi:DNA repair protein RecO (recombination protein O)
VAAPPVDEPMPVHSAEALVLRTYRYGEADRIVVFLTEDRGKKRGVARNATNSRRRFGAALEPLTRGRATYVERETRELVRLDRIEPHVSPLAAAAGSDVGQAAHRLAHAAYFAELLDEWAPDSSPNERLFRLGASVGDALGLAGSVSALARYFEYWLLRLEGVYPALAACPRCGGSLDKGFVLVAAERAYCCASCAEGGVRLSGEAWRFLTRARGHTPREVAEAGAPEGALRELEQAHHRLMATHLEKPLRSARIVRELGTDS